MRATMRAAVAAVRRMHSGIAYGQLHQLEGFAAETTAKTSGMSRSTGAWGLATIAAAAAAASYTFSSQPVARAEAPWQPENSTPQTAPEDRYKRPVPHGLPSEVVLYQYEVCPFCCKVKALLDYYKIPYRCVEVNPLTKAEIKWSNYKKVPVLVLDGEQLNDSSAIMSRLAAEVEAAGSSKAGKASTASSSSSGDRPAKKGWLAGLFGGGESSTNSSTTGNTSLAAAAATPGTLAEEERWRRWVDDWFVKVITVNIYRNMRESWQTFDYITEAGNFGWATREAARVVGASMMWGLSGRLRKKYGVEGDVRDNLYSAANEWVAAMGDRPFLGGAAPNLADLSVFGVVRAVTGTDTFNDLMQNSKIGLWYARMFEAVGPSSRVA